MDSGFSLKTSITRFKCVHEGMQSCWSMCLYRKPASLGMIIPYHGPPFRRWMSRLELRLLRIAIGCGCGCSCGMCHVHSRMAVILPPHANWQHACMEMSHLERVHRCWTDTCFFFSTIVAEEGSLALFRGFDLMDRPLTDLFSTTRADFRRMCRAGFLSIESVVDLWNSANNLGFIAANGLTFRLARSIHLLVHIPGMFPIE